MALYVAFSLTYPDAVFTCLVPVSYTHLDVYKRQEPGESDFELILTGVTPEQGFLVAYCQVLKVYYEENIICLLGKYLPLSLIHI